MNAKAQTEARYVVTVDGPTVRLKMLRPVLRTQRHPLLFGTVVVAWAFVGMAVAGGTATHRVLELLVASIFGGASAVLSFGCYDREKHRGRRRVREALALRFATGPVDYRTSPGINVEIDGESIAEVGHVRLVLRRWFEPYGRAYSTPPVADSELCLVAGRRVYVVASAVEACKVDEEDRPLRAPEGTEWSASTLCGLMMALHEATEGRIALDPSPFNAAEVTRRYVNPWPGTIVAQGLVTLFWVLLVLHWVGFSHASDPPWFAAAYLAVFALFALPSPARIRAALASSRAASVLRAHYADVEPSSGASRWRPWPAFLFAVAVCVTFTIGWAHFFPANMTAFWGGRHAARLDR